MRLGNAKAIRASALSVGKASECICGIHVQKKVNHQLQAEGDGGGREKGSGKGAGGRREEGGSQREGRGRNQEGVGRLWGGQEGQMGRGR